MGGEFIGTYFFVPLDRRPSSDDELFRMLGCELTTSAYGPFFFVELGVEVLSYHVCAQVYFLRASLINALAETYDQDLPVERDPLLSLATTIRDGAVRLGVEVAFLEIHRPVLASILENYWMVLGRDATALAAEWFSLLYMNDLVIKDWDPGPVLGDRDELPGGPGRTLFAGRGRNRWC